MQREKRAQDMAVQQEQREFDAAKQQCQFMIDQQARAYQAQMDIVKNLNFGSFTF